MEPYQMPSIPPDPNLIISQIVPLIGMLIGLIGMGFVALGPIGRAIGDVIRRRLGGHDGLKPGDVEEIVGRLEQIQHHLGEMAERQDFTDRMLAPVRKEKALPGASDVQR